MSEHYLKKILKISSVYLKKEFGGTDLEKFEKRIQYIFDIKNRDEIIEQFIKEYIKTVKESFQNSYKSTDKKLCEFIENSSEDIKIIWGDALKTLKSMKPESVHVMVTSPPYYNAREYSQWTNLESYLNDMRKIVRESFRVLDNHRVFVFNVGDIFDNDNLVTSSVWGKRRLPLGAYFIKIFEEEGFTFVDDIIWDKGEVQSSRHMNGSKPYPFYQYPINSYEHILVFHKHRLDKTRYPCPVCGTLKVSGNTQSEVGLQSWECKNDDCFKRSVSNRGKRFSLKSIITQGSQTIENAIQEKHIKKWRKDIVGFSPVIKIDSKGRNKLGHTAPYPEDIPEYAIEMFSYPGEIVLDPFAGSFTSAIVAKKLDRVGVGIEINKKMFRDAIIKNIEGKLKLPLFSDDSQLFEEYDYLDAI